ncbi:elongation factor P maturation arginine rhamnosyltransferase EarP [Allopusillimonas soli]|uniref:elongation factor P maturation arginine rhamnosyltransferase EarP n=1 Tax=Allopusillimonas soli TaxID=659016 RepID=UPI001FD69821|nr:elongation factor P maturation arginine rhamnosyltransferase EarP [Allopusillimonas soli]
MTHPSFDLFCRVVDNFGDIGVCWRLARQLARRPDTGPVRIWVDDMAAFSCIEPGAASAIPSASATMRIADVDIVPWRPDTALPAPHDVVIEAFACDPPAAFVASMASRDSFWINLEYLSAEPWVRDFHALPSLRPDGLRKAFFFPGFEAGTGGLLREPGLLSQRDQWLADPDARWFTLSQAGVPAPALAMLREGARQIMLFCYPHAPVNGLVHALQAQPQPSVMLVPAGVCPALRRGQHGSLLITEISFVSQDMFDRLLWSSDLNCVRGEDSLVRALWAARPMLWHVYPQAQDAHMAKLRAWLALAPYDPTVGQVMRCWNTEDDDALCAALSACLGAVQYQAWAKASEAWCKALSAQRDLASALLDFWRQARKLNR